MQTALRRRHRVDGGEEAGHDECSQAYQKNIDADQRGPHIVVANGDKGFAKRAAYDPMHQVEANPDDDQNKEVLEGRIGEAPD